ncbi:MAG: outer membrane beta-barrel protein [Bacteroidales bacterium]|nr:outer membrane beta-barrel protein [Candidatus Cacconaster caballi]
MKILKYILSALLIAAGSFQLAAEDYAIEVDAEKKTIHIGKIALPGNVPLLDYLNTLPEFSNRNGGTFLDRYDLKIDGKLVGDDAKDAVLANTFLREVEKIEISTSPSETHIKNGISGTINIIPVAIRKGVSGDVSVQYSTATGIMPTASIRYSDGKKFEISADLDFDIYYPDIVTLEERYGAGYSIVSEDTVKVNYYGHMARIYAKWAITDKDVLKIWLRQNHSTSRLENSSFITRVDDMSPTMGRGWQYTSTERRSSKTSTKSLSMTAIANYERSLKRGHLQVNTDYTFSSGSPLERDEFNTELESLTKFDIRGRQLNVKAVLNSSLQSDRGIQNGLAYLSPMIQLIFNGKHIKAILNGRYKSYSRTFAKDGCGIYNGWSHDWSAEANAIWQMKDHHALRLKLIRSTGVADNSLVYPELIYDGDKQVWVKGNPDLKGSVTNSANLEYITDWTNGRHSLIFEASAEYNVQGRQIDYTLQYAGGSGVSYLFPVNTNYSDVVSFTSMLNWSYGPFWVTVGGNYFYNVGYARTYNLKASYFNFHLTPSVKLDNNWLINASYRYNSKVYKENGTLGECSVLTLRVSKSLKRWSFHLGIRGIFDHYTTDEERTSSEVIYKTYDTYKRTVFLGANFNI